MNCQARRAERTKLTRRAPPCPRLARPNGIGFRWLVCEGELMPNFDFTAPDGRSYSVQGPDGSTPEQAFQILQSQIGGGTTAPSSGVSEDNSLVRSAATGVPIIGGALNKLEAGTNAALAPALNRFFKPEDQLSEVPPLPKGYALDRPPLPAGYKLDHAPDIGDDRAATVAGLRGIPIAGAYVDKATAMLNAAAQPYVGAPGMSEAPTYAERVAENEKRVKEGTDAYEKAHPVETTIGKTAVGAGALAPLGATALGARAFGLTGTLPGMMMRGAASGAALGGVDAAARGEDIGQGAEFGLGGGIAGPVIGRAVGKTASAIADRFRPSTATPMNTVRIGNTEIPLSESQVTQNPAASAEEQILLRGGRGDRAQEVAQSHADLQDTRVNQAKDEIGQGLNPAAPTPVTPHAAGEQVASELSQSEQARQAARSIQDAALEAQHGNIAASLDPSGQSATVLPSRAGEIISDAARREAATAATSEQAADQALRAQQQSTRAGLAQGANLTEDTHHAAEITSQAVRNASDAARARTSAAYETMRQLPGEFDPAGFRNAGQSIRRRLSAGESPVYVNSSTPMAEQALGIIDHQVGGARFPNAAEPNRPLVRNQNGSVGPAPRPITPTSVEEVRKQLVGLASDARAGAARSGVQSDVRAMRGVINAFDNHVRDAVRAGGFSGDGPAFLNQLRTARGLHSDYRNTFTSQGGSDKVGRVLEEIIGRDGVGPSYVRIRGQTWWSAGCPSCPEAAPDIR
jgi:hypothetical protein